MSARRVRRIRPGFLQGFAASLLFGVTALIASVAQGQILSEFVAEHTGADTQEYLEIYAIPESDYSSLSILVLEGDASEDRGRVDAVYPVGVTDIAGFWHTGFLTPDSLEDGTLSLLLAGGFSGSVGSDLDTDDDGTLDVTPWASLFDSVSVSDGGGADRTYSPAVLTAGFDGVAVVPGGASRFPYGLDTDAASDWKRDDPDNAMLPGGTVSPGEAYTTPGMPNLVGLTDYYASVDNSSSAALRATIHEAINDHVRYPYFSDPNNPTTETWTILEQADRDPGNSSNVLDVYKNVSYANHGGTGSNPNREHTWPQSYGFPDEAAGNSPRTDCHHLFVSDNPYNADRGNHPYGTCSAGCSERSTVLTNGSGGGTGTYPGNSNWLNAGSRTWETWIGRRGDVARAILYMDLRYESGNHSFTGYPEPNLRLTDDPNQIVTSGGVNASEAYMGRLTALLQWHAQDPPDAKERSRNDAVYRFQANRNPFIDHPEWVACVFQAMCDFGPTATPTPTVTGTPPTATATGTPTATRTASATRTATRTPTTTRTPTVTRTPTITVTPGGPTFTPTITATPGQGGTELFFSEYVEGSSNNRAVEIFNPTGSPVSLAPGQYVVQIYANGNTTPNTAIALVGLVPAGGVFVLANNQASFSENADQISGGVTFNGNDAVVLRKGGADGVLVDVIGVVGIDPGTAWTGGGLSTLNQTLVRKPTVFQGDTNSADAFDPSVEWLGFPLDDVTNLGAHAFQGPLTQTPTATATMTRTATGTATITPTATITVTPPATFTATATSTTAPPATFTATSVFTATATRTTTPATFTPTATFTATAPATFTATATRTPTSPATSTATSTATRTGTPPASVTQTSTPDAAATPTATGTPLPGFSPTPTATVPEASTATPTATGGPPPVVRAPGSGLLLLLVPLLAGAILFRRPRVRASR